MESGFGVRLQKFISKILNRGKNLTRQNNSSITRQFPVHESLKTTVGNVTHE